MGLEKGRISRRRFVQMSFGSAATMLLGRSVFGMAAGKDVERPNILWISCEDTGLELGCYGDSYARTPFLDEFASEGVRFTNAFANIGVCAPARSCIITGTYPTTIGTNYMRCKGVPPAYAKCFSEYLRAAGYYCTNNKKTDYQFDPPGSAWDDCSGRAHYGNCQPDQPFFAVFNITISHESKIRDREKWIMDRFKRIERHDPDRAPVPPYHPDTPAVREDWAQYYDIVTLMDSEAGEILTKLEKDGLAEDTIVWFWGDHGAGMPRHKRWIYDSGIKVPLIIRVPKKWRKWVMSENPGAPKPGSVNDALVSFVDFAPTVLSLAGVKIPEYMQGQAFLGSQRVRPREYIFAARDRMDERCDIIRAVRDKRYKYLRNYMPHVTYGQYINYMDQMPTMKDMRRLDAEGKLTGAQTQYFRKTKPIEELFDTQTDPHEINNLAGRAEHKDVLERMRQVHTKWMKETRDVGLICEPEFDEMKRPGGEWEKTEAPVFSTTLGRSDHVTITCPTKGASIVYKINGGKGRQLYTKPVRLKASQTVTARACRIGFTDSDEVTFKRGDAPQSPARPTEKRAHWRERLDKTDLLERLMSIKQLDYKGNAAIPEYLKALDDKDGSVRYWAVVGLGWRCETAEQMDKAKTAIEPMLEDKSPTVRVAAAEALCNWGKEDKALGVLVEMLKHKANKVRLFAAIALGEIGEKARPATEAIEQAARDDTGMGKYVNRICTRTLALLNGRK